MEAIDTIETLRQRAEDAEARVAKLNGWLNEHEHALAKARREINDLNRKRMT